MENDVMKNRMSIFTTILLALSFLALFPTAQAVVPAPDGGYPGGNTAEGQNALMSLNVNTGTNNTAVGWFSLRSTVEGQFNTAVGAGTLFNNTANRNTAIGGAAMFSNTSGSFNTAVGMLSLFTNSTGSSNTAIGDGALLNNITGNFNTAIGRVALLSNTEGGGNTATGMQALVSNTTGDRNTAYGYQAMLDNTTGDGNTAVGFAALGNNTLGEDNTATGDGALASNTFGIFNTAIGSAALAGNTTGHGNIAVGRVAGNNITTANNVICIGTAVHGENEDNRCFIGNIYGQSSISAIPVMINPNNKLGTISSSKRFKEAIKPMDKSSEKLFALRPVTFRYKKDIDPNRTSQFGLVAEEVEKINPNLVVHDKGGKPYSVRYDQVNAMLLNEFLKEHRKVEELEKQVETLTAGLQKVSAQLTAASPSRGGLEASKFAAGRIRGGGPAPQVVSNP
jgi:hypothetical protein